VLVLGSRVFVNYLLIKEDLTYTSPLSSKIAMLSWLSASFFHSLINPGLPSLNTMIRGLL